MRFLDSSVFLHAYIRPRRTLTPKEEEIKNRAKKIIERIDSGKEEVLTTVVHVSEIANIIESRLGLQKSINVAARILSLNNIKLVGVDEEDYMEALFVSTRFAISINDAIAYIKMRENSIDEIYTFDKHFRNIPGIKIVQK